MGNEALNWDGQGGSATLKEAVIQLFFYFVISLKLNAKLLFCNLEDLYLQNCKVATMSFNIINITIVRNISSKKLKDKCYMYEVMCMLRKYITKRKIFQLILSFGLNPVTIQTFHQQGVIFYIFFNHDQLQVTLPDKYSKQAGNQTARDFFGSIFLLFSYASPGE